MNLPITTRVAKARGCGSSPAKQLKRSTKVALKAAKTAIKGRKALTETSC